MLDTLLESKAAPARRTGGTLASTLVHAALFAGAITATARGPAARPPRPEEWVLPPIVVSRPPEAPSVRPAPPSTATPSMPSAPRLPTVARVPDGIPPIDVEVSVPIASNEEAARGGSGPIGQSSGTSSGGLAGPPDGVLEERYVDRAPRIIGSPVPPVFPLQLREQGREGRVAIQFVIDTLGRAEMASLRVVEASEPLFVQSVRAALPRYRFSPGEVSGRRVRTLVQLPFDFTLRR